MNPLPRGRNTVKRNSERRIPRKSSENRRLFTGANLVVRPASDKIILGCWGWIFVERLGTQILSGIQFARHFIEFVDVETKRFVDSTVNVILRQQTCGQLLCMSAGSKHRAPAFYFSMLICYMF